MVFFILSHFADKIKRQYKFSKLFFKNLLQIFSIYGIIATLRKTHADVAQLVEQLIRNQQVAGSSPAISSKKDIVGFSCYVLFRTHADEEPRKCGVIIAYFNLLGLSLMPKM